MTRQHAESKQFVYFLEALHRVGRLLTKLRGIQAGDPGSIDGALDDLRVLKIASCCDGHDAVARPCDQLGICLQTSRAANPSERATHGQRILDLCRQILRCCVALQSGEVHSLHSAPCDSRQPEAHANQHSVTSASLGRRIYIGRGVTATSEPGIVRIHLPRIAPPSDGSEIGAALDEISQWCPRDSSWIVDLSALDYVPIRLVGTLAAHWEDRRSRGEDVTIVGSHPNVAPNTWPPALDDYFSAGRPKVRATDTATARNARPADEGPQT